MRGVGSAATEAIGAKAGEVAANEKLSQAQKNLDEKKKNLDDALSSSQTSPQDDDDENIRKLREESGGGVSGGGVSRSVGSAFCSISFSRFFWAFFSFSLAASFLDLAYSLIYTCGNTLIYLST